MKLKHKNKCFVFTVLQKNCETCLLNTHLCMQETNYWHCQEHMYVITNLHSEMSDDVTAVRLPPSGYKEAKMREWVTPSHGSWSSTKWNCGQFMNLIVSSKSSQILTDYNHLRSFTMQVCSLGTSPGWKTSFETWVSVFCYPTRDNPQESFLKNDKNFSNFYYCFSFHAFQFFLSSTHTMVTVIGFNQNASCV